MTKRRRRPSTADEGLRASEGRYRTLFEQMSEGFALHEVILDGDGRPCDYRFLDVNPAFERLTGLRRADVLGRTVREALPGTEPFWIETFGAVALTGEPARVESFSAALGRHYEAFAYRPAPLRFAVLFTDITARKRTDEALRRANDELEARVRDRTAELAAERGRLFSVLETLPVYVILLTRDHRVAFANRFFRERFGESGGRRCYEYLFQRSEPCATCESYKSLDTRAPHNWQWIGPDGRSYDIYDFPFADADGSERILEMGIDVTERERALGALTKLAESLERRVRERTADLEDSEARLKQATSLFEAVTRGTGVIVAAIDTSRRYTYFNEAYGAEVARLTGKELRLGMSLDEALAHQPEQQSVALGEWNQVLGGEATDKTVDFGAPSHHRRTYRVLHTPLRDSVGRITGAGEVALDVTERVRAEEALRESEGRLNRAQELAHMGSWELDLGRNELTWSDETYRIFGLVPREVGATYQTFLELVHPEDRAAVDAAYARSIGEERDAYEIEHRVVRRGSGEVRWVLEKCQHLRDAGGAVVRSRGMVLDVTELRVAEQSLRRSLLEREVLLKEIHHRVKNNLQIVASLLSLQARGAEDEHVRLTLVESQNRVQALAFVHQLLYGAADLSTIRVREYFERLLGSLRECYATIAPGVVVELHVNDLALKVDSAVPLALVFNELVSNAFKHAFPGGRRGRIRVELQPAGAGRHRLSVADDGQGLPEGLDVHACSSLGLLLVQTLCQQLGATLEAHRGPGARFVVDFPTPDM